MCCEARILTGGSSFNDFSSEKLGGCQSKNINEILRLGEEMWLFFGTEVVSKHYHSLDPVKSVVAEFGCQ